MNNFGRMLNEHELAQIIAILLVKMGVFTFDITEEVGREFLAVAGEKALQITSMEGGGLRLEMLARSDISTMVEGNGVVQ